MTDTARPPATLTCIPPADIARETAGAREDGLPAEYRPPTYPPAFK